MLPEQGCWFKQCFSLSRFASCLKMKRFCFQSSYLDGLNVVGATLSLGGENTCLSVCLRKATLH